MQRIYLEKRPSHEFRTDDSELHHQFSRVLRARVGDRVAFFGEDWSSEYEISEITKKEIIFLWKRDLPVALEKLRITLFQSIPNKIEKIEYLVQKGVEVGISRFVFFRSDRSQPLPVLEKKLDRIRQIAQEALEQSGGFQLPQIIVTDEILPVLSELEKLVIFHTAQDDRTKTMREFAGSIPSIRSIGMLVGPEGGFADEEVERYIALGALPVSLGQRILRTETAGVVAAFSLLQAR